MSLTLAFTAGLPLQTNRLRSVQQQFLSKTHNNSTCTTSMTYTAKSKPRSSPPQRGNRGKRVATFRKLQTRHRQGPAEFRRAAAKTSITKEDLVTTTTATPDESQQTAIEGAETAEKIRYKNRYVGNKKNVTKLRDLKVGQKFKGTINNTVRHGVYVNIGCTRDGLVHIRDMATDFVHEVEDLVRPGDSIDVWVKYIDPKGHVLGLTMVEPVLGFEKERITVDKLIVGQRVEGAVQRITNFGAYVDIGCVRLGFVHVKCIWGRRPKDTLMGLKLGQKITTRIIEIDGVKSYIKLLARGKHGQSLLANETDEDNTDGYSVGFNVGEIIVKDENDKILEGDVVQKKALLRVGEELNDGYNDGDVKEIDSIDIDGLTKEMWSNLDEEIKSDEDDDEFDFADDMLMDQSNKDDIDNDDSSVAESVDLSKIAHMVDEDTEFVGLDDSEIEKLRKLRSQLEQE